ncbi:MAG: ABC transporter substrate-binding protein [Erysipelotrichaceae bacterium]|nr:ABC transporter substrate-binding protein [Erysipelotrichaceae bacterium]
MKKLLSLLVVIAMVLTLGACSSGSSKSNGELYIFLPGEYISDDAIKQFKQETGIDVKVTTFDSNESMYTKLLGGTSYDIIIPSDYMIERLIAEKMVQKLDKSKLTCLDELCDDVKNTEYDPNNDYSVPYFWGNVGIVYDTTIVDSKDVESEGWKVLQNTKYAGQIYMYDSIRDSFMIAEKALGYSMNTTSEEEINAAYDWLKVISDTMDPAFVTDEAIDGLVTGEKAMGMMYSGDAAYILSENENMAYYAPKEGTNYWIDAMVIHADAKNVDNAYEFINFITSYDGAYENSSYVGYASVNAQVLEDITAADGDYEGNEAYIPRAKTSNDETFHSNTDALKDALKLASELWVKVKS